VGDTLRFFAILLAQGQTPDTQTTQNNHHIVNHTATRLTPDRYTAFYYTAKAVNEGKTTPVEHLAIGQAHNVVANGHRKHLAEGTIVVNYAKAADKWLAQVGISTGNYVPDSAKAFWPEWSGEPATVFEVVWITKIVDVPVELFAGHKQKLHLDRVEGVANYVLRHSR